MKGFSRAMARGGGKEERRSKRPWRETSKTRLGLKYSFKYFNYKYKHSSIQKYKYNNFSQYLKYKIQQTYYFQYTCKYLSTISLI